MIRNPRQKSVTKARRKRLGVIVAIAVVLLGGTLFALWATDTFPFKKDKVVVPVHNANSETKGELPNAIDTTPDDDTDNNSNWPSDNKAPDVETTGKLKIPEGNFVSNHRPNLSGSPAPSDMQSSCVTTPGATCEIIFTKDGVTKSLPAKKTDIGGGAFWNWKLQDIGLTEGDWQVHAKATLGSQTQTAADQINLKVAP